MYIVLFVKDKIQCLNKMLQQFYLRNSLAQWRHGRIPPVSAIKIRQLIFSVCVPQICTIIIPPSIRLPPAPHAGVLRQGGERVLPQPPPLLSSVCRPHPPVARVEGGASQGSGRSEGFFGSKFRQSCVLAVTVGKCFEPIAT